MMQLEIHIEDSIPMDLSIKDLEVQSTELQSFAFLTLFWDMQDIALSDAIFLCFEYFNRRIQSFLFSLVLFILM